MNTNTAAPLPTDSLRALARRHGMTPGEVRAAALDLELPVRYSKERHTWVLDADALTVRAFSVHLAVMNAG